MRRLSALFTLGLPAAPRIPIRLTSPAHAARRTVLQKVRGRALAALPQLLDTGFQVLFHSPPGVLFTFPSQYSALSVTKEYSALRGGPRSFPQGFSCPVVLWTPPGARYASPTGLSPPPAGLPRAVRLLRGRLSWRSEPRRARAAVWAPPVSLAATPGIDFSFFSSGYLDVSVRRVPPARLWIRRAAAEGSSAGFPHSDTRGSLDICSSPRLFAACRVFRRLLVPRHPPCALLCLTSRAAPSVAPPVPCVASGSSFGSCFWFSFARLFLTRSSMSCSVSARPPACRPPCRRFLKILISSIRFSRCNVCPADAPRSFCLLFRIRQWA